MEIKKFLLRKNEVSSNKLIFYNTLSTILLYAITFFSAPLFSRLLGKGNYGVVQVYNTWVSFFTVIMGLYTRGTLSIAKVNFNNDEFKKYQSSVLFLSLVGFICVVGLMIIFNRFIISFFGLGLGYLVIMLFHSFGTYCVYFLNTKFTYEMKARNNLIVSVTLALVNLGLSFFLLKYLELENLYAGRIIGMSIPYIVTGLIVIIYVFRQGKSYYDRKYWRFCLPLCIPLIFHGISGIICASSDRIMIEKMMGYTTVGIYALAYNFANIMDSIWGALHNSWDPFFFDHVRNGQYDILKTRSKRYLRLFTCLSIGFILLTPEVYHVFASEEYWEGVNVIPVVVLSAYSVFIYAFAANYEFCFKRTGMVAVGSVIAGVSNIVLNIIFINSFGYFGAAIATLLSNVILAVVHIIFARRIVKDKWVFDFKMFVLPVFCLLVSVILFFGYYERWCIRWGVALIVGIYMLLKIFKDKTIF